MTTSPLSLTSTDHALIEARVVTLTPRTTAWGDRIYAVFQAVDGSTLGYWDHADHPILCSLRLGDSITLRRKANGRLTLAPEPVHQAEYGLFNLLQRLWRLL